MAWKMKLTRPYQGMPFIWNVSRHVGINNRCENHSVDVELVQRLLILHRSMTGAANRAPGIGFLTEASGRMDVQTAFEIVYTDAYTYDAENDGVVSPARDGQMGYGAGMWFIARLNFVLFERDRTRWEALPEVCTPTLRAALQVRTAP